MSTVKAVWQVVMNDITKGQRDYGYPLLTPMPGLFSSERTAQLEADRLNTQPSLKPLNPDDIGWHLVRQVEVIDRDRWNKMQDERNSAEQQRILARAQRLEAEADKLRKQALLIT